MTGDAAEDDLAQELRNSQIGEIREAGIRSKLVFRLVFTGFIISGLIALMIIGGVIWISVQNVSRAADNQLTIPAVLENWGGVIVGFYFGAFITLIKDFIKSP